MRCVDSINNYIVRIKLLTGMCFQETGSTGTAKAIYQCNYGLVVDPPESQVRHCVRGKWTGQNPQCGN